MKVSESRTPAVQAKKNQPFFRKGAGNDFFQSGEAAGSFFSNGGSKPVGIQTKLTVGQPGDVYEKEADAVADKVVQGAGRPMVVQAMGLTPAIQEKCAHCEQQDRLDKKEECSGSMEQDKLQKKDGGGRPAGVSPGIESGLNASKGKGSPMPGRTQAQMESSFGGDLSKVRIHDNDSAAAMSKNLNAQAFTHGKDIYFNSGKYDPESRTGQHLLAHELTHVVQQGGGAPAVQRLPSLDDIGQGLSDAYDAGTQALQDAGKALYQAGADTINVVSDAASSAAGAVSDAASSAVGAVSSAASGVVSWIASAAGKAAVALAGAIVSRFGGSVTIAGTTIIIDIPDVPLFDSFQKEIGDEMPPIPLLHIPLGAVVVGPVAAEAGLEVNLTESLLAALGPGEIRNIRLMFNPAAGSFEGLAQLYIAGALGYRLSLFGGLVGRAATAIPADPPIPIEGSLEGGLRGTGTGWGIGAISSKIDLAYRSGTWSFDADNDLMFGMLLTGDLDLYAAARLYEVLVCEYAYPLKHWETGEAYKINIPVSLGGGAPPTIGPVTHGPMPIEDIETAIEPLSYGLNCKSLQEIIAELCDEGFLPKDVCEFLQDVLDDANEPIDNLSIAGNCVAKDNLGETADSFISRCCIAKIRREFPSDLLTETIGNIRKGKTAKHKKAKKLLNDQRFKKPGASSASAASNRVRLQLQHKGDDVVDSEKIEGSAPITVAQGHAGVDALMGRTSKSVGKACTDAAKQMKKTIAGYPPKGVSAVGNVARKWCKEHPDFKRGIRMDLENLAGTNFTS